MKDETICYCEACYLLGWKVAQEDNNTYVLVHKHDLEKNDHKNIKDSGDDWYLLHRDYCLRGDSNTRSCCEIRCLKDNNRILRKCTYCKKNYNTTKKQEENTIKKQEIESIKTKKKPKKEKKKKSARHSARTVKKKINKF